MKLRIIKALPPLALIPMKAYDSSLEYLKTSDMDFSEWLSEEKFDGARYTLHIRGGQARLMSSNISKKDNKPVEKTDNVPHLTKNPALKAWYARYEGTVLDGEIIVPGVSKSSEVTKIMGAAPAKAIERQKKTKVIFRVFDILFEQGVNRQGDTQFDRSVSLQKVLKNLPKGMQHMTQVEQVYLESYADVEKHYKKVLSQGGEGLILKNVKSVYQQDSRKRNTWLKIKKLDTYDVVVTGIKHGEGKYKNTLGALVCSQYVKGKLTEVTLVSGMTDAQRNHFFKQLGGKKGYKPKEIQQVTKDKYFVVEIEAQQREPKTHRYRHPRFVQVREGKPMKDCTWR